MPRQLTRVRVDPELRDRFLAQFPGSGSLAWVMETAMEEVLQLTKGTPDATQLVRAAIRAAVLRERRHRKELDSTKQAPAALATARVEPLAG